MTFPAFNFHYFTWDYVTERFRVFPVTVRKLFVRLDKDSGKL